MSGITRHIIGSLSKHLKEYTDANSITVAWENMDFTPPTDDLAKWIRPTVVFGQTNQVTVGTSGQNRIVGTMIINVFGPLGRNAGSVNQLADALITKFIRGLDTPAVSGYSVRVTNSWREAGIPEERWFNIPVKIKFYTDVTNV